MVVTVFSDQVAVMEAQVLQAAVVDQLERAGVLEKAARSDESSSLSLPDQAEGVRRPGSRAIVENRQTREQ